jgi:hypothetical protein
VDWFPSASTVSGILDAASDRGTHADVPALQIDDYPRQSVKFSLRNQEELVGHEELLAALHFDLKSSPNAGVVSMNYSMRSQGFCSLTRTPVVVGSNKNPWLSHRPATAAFCPPSVKRSLDGVVNTTGSWPCEPLFNESV